MLPSQSGSDCRHETWASLPVIDPTHVGAVRRKALELASRFKLDETQSGKAALIVTEAGTNLIKHAGQGEILLHAFEEDGNSVLEVLALDQGPGMSDLSRCLRDGYSTRGSSGTGLGAISRLADSVDIYTFSQMGTALLAQLSSSPTKLSATSAEPTDKIFEAEAIHLPQTGEEVCGDGWAVEQHVACQLFMMVDGLGHGPLAASASQQAIRVFRQSIDCAPAEILQRMHAALRPTRGAAAAVAKLDQETRQLRFAGIGNISASIWTAGKSQSLVSHNGIVGHQVRKIQEFVYSFPQGSMLVMHSDGLGTQWRLEQYPGLSMRRALLIAGVLYRDFKRGRDDVTVLVAREFSGGTP